MCFDEARFQLSTSRIQREGCTSRCPEHFLFLFEKFNSTQPFIALHFIELQTPEKKSPADCHKTSFSVIMRPLHVLFLTFGQKEVMVDYSCFDLIPQLVWLTDANGAIAYLNSFWRSYTGSNSTRWTDYIHPDDLPETFRKRQIAFDNLSEFQMEYRIKNPQGTYRWFLARAIPHTDKEQNAVMWFGTCTDIHDRIEATMREQDAIRSSEVRSRFFANISHDLRTPIHGILGFSNLMLEGPLDRKSVV